MRRTYFGVLGFLFVALLAAAADAQPATPVAGHEHGAGWTTVAASHVVAVQTKWGVVTSAEVQLKMCYLASIVARTEKKFDYVVQDEREPGAGDICGMGIRSATVAISEAGKTQHVRVTSADAETTVVKPVLANSLVKF